MRASKVGPAPATGRISVRTVPHRHDLGGLPVAIATAEDTILAKLEWARTAGGSERQLADALGVVQVCGDRLDRGYIGKWAVVLGVDDLWHAVLDQVGSSDGG